ncbi:MAG: DUF1893 domain-containing protein [Clostridiales bacterium]|nr:DUF1893 domain-containing protein [Clostridiales bacterium]
MSDLEKARRLLEQEGYSCVLCKGGATHVSRKRGVSPLLGWLEDGLDMSGFSAADKIVGKAAAMLFALGGVKAVYAPVMSEKAAALLEKQKVAAFYGQTVPAVINRAGDGICPMEQAVSGLEDPSKAPEVLRGALAALRAQAEPKNCKSDV